MEVLCFSIVAFVAKFGVPLPYSPTLRCFDEFLSRCMFYTFFPFAGVAPVLAVNVASVFRDGSVRRVKSGKLPIRPTMRIAVFGATGGTVRILFIIQTNLRWLSPFGAEGTNKTGKTSRRTSN